VSENVVILRSNTYTIVSERGVTVGFLGYLMEVVYQSSFDLLM
jgi:hypothetical protein